MMELTTREQKLQYKKELKAQCIAMLSERMEAARQAMNSAQEAANSEEKSSAGDKYETGRAMSQIERDNYAARLEEVQQEMNLLQSMDTDKIYETVNNGAVIRSGDAIYFIAIGLGVIHFRSQKVAVLSPRSPFAAAVRDKSIGDKVSFHGSDISISDIF